MVLVEVEEVKQVEILEVLEQLIKDLQVVLKQVVLLDQVVAVLVLSVAMLQSVQTTVVLVDQE